MKPIPYFIHFLIVTLALGLASGLSAQVAKKTKVAEIRDAASHDELSARLRMAQQKDPLRKVGPPTGNREEDPSKRSAERDIVKESTIVCYGGLVTLVPKEAVLHIPEALQDRIGEKPNVDIVTWQDFYRANRGWIRTVDITREQAMGHKALSESKLSAIKQSSTLVVATFKGGPISVLPPKDPEEIPSPSEMKPVTYRK